MTRLPSRQVFHFFIDVGLQLIEKTIKAVQDPINIRKLPFALQPVVIQQPGGGVPFRRRIEDAVDHQVTEDLIQRIRTPETAPFLILDDKGVNPQKPVHGFQEVIAVVEEAVSFRIHHFRYRDFNTQVSFFLKGVITGMDFLPERIGVFMVFEVAKTLDGALFRRGIWIGSVALGDTDLCFNRTIFKFLFIFSYYNASPESIYI